MWISWPWARHHVGLISAAYSVLRDEGSCSPTGAEGNVGPSEGETSASFLCVLCSPEPPDDGWGLRVTRPRRGRERKTARVAMFLIMQSTDWLFLHHKETKRLSSQFRGVVGRYLAACYGRQLTLTSDFMTDGPRKCHSGLLHTFTTMRMEIMWDHAVTWKLNFLKSEWWDWFEKKHI